MEALTETRHPLRQPLLTSPPLGVFKQQLQPKMLRLTDGVQRMQDYLERTRLPQLRQRAKELRAQLQTCREPACLPSTPD